MIDRFTPVMRALVAASLLLATVTLMLVAVNTARAAGASAVALGTHSARPLVSSTGHRFHNLLIRNI